MSKKLPSVYASPINKKIDNTQDLYYSALTRNNPKEYSLNEIIKKINDIFNSPNHVYKSRVVITTSNNALEEIIVGRTANSILTIDGKVIKISDIKNIEKK